MIPYGRQDITEADINSVIDILKSDFLTQGPTVPLFEQTVSEKVGAKHAIAVNNATNALHLACMALDLEQDDWLWTTPITFVASANCGLYCRAQVDFVDIDPGTYNLCPNALEKKLINAERKDKLPKVLVAVHLCGQPCNMQAIHSLAQRFNFKIIEDASHAIGGKYLGQHIGSCHHSDITVFSFHPVKIITTAEGGMALTNDDELAKKMNLLRSHGVTRDERLMKSKPHGQWYYEQIELGYNYRMTELQAALGISQIKRLERFVSVRHNLSHIYNEKLKELPVTLPLRIKGTYSSLHLYVIRLQLTVIKKTHREVFEELRKKGIGVNLHYIPIHIQPYYRAMGFKWGDYPEAEKYYHEAISIPIFHTMTPEEQNKVIIALEKILL